MGIISTNPGSSGTVSGGSGGKIYAFNNITDSSLVQVAPANPARQNITFHNPGTYAIYVSTTVIQTSGSDAAFTPSNAAFGGCFLVSPGGGSLTVDGECQKAWQAFAITGAGAINPLTVVENNL